MKGTILFISLACFWSFSSLSQDLDSMLNQLTTYENQDPGLAIEVGRVIRDESRKRNLDSVYCSMGLRLGKIWRNKGEVDSAKYYLNDFLRECDSNFVDLYVQAHVQLSRLFTLSGNPEMGEKHLKIASRKLDQINDLSVSYAVSQEYSSFYHNTKDYDAMRNSSLNTLSIAKQMNSPSFLATAHSTLGVCYTELKKLDSALLHNRKAVNLAIELNNPSQIASTSLNLGATFRNLMEYDSALHYINLAMNLADSIDNNDYLLAASFTLSYLYADMGDYKKAYNQLMNTTQFYSNFLSENHIKAVNDLELKYNTEKKEREIEFLSAENEFKEKQNHLLIFIGLLLSVVAIVSAYALYVRNKSNKKLKQLNANKTTFFAVVSHDLKNLISSFSGMGEIARIYVEKKQFDRFESITKMLDQSAQNLNEFLDNLLNWSIVLLDKKPYEPQNISIKTAVDKALEQIKPFLISKRISLTNHTENIEVFADKHGLDIIVRNLISNAAKHCPQDGQLNIGCTKESKGIEFWVENSITERDSVRLKQLNLREKAAQIRNSDMNNSTGLGLFLVQEFAELNKSSISFKLVERDRVRFSVLFG